MAIDLHPDYAAAYLCCGLTKYLKGDHEGAIVDLDRAVALFQIFHTYISVVRVLEKRLATCRAQKKTIGNLAS